MTIKHMIFAILIGIMVVPLAIPLMDRDVPFERLSGTIMPEHPRAGQLMHVRWEGNLKRYCEGTVSRWVVDSDDYTWSLGTTSLTSNDSAHGGTTVRTGRPVRLPSGIPPGPAHYYSIVRSTCNWTHYLPWPGPIIYTSPPLPFTVTPKNHALDGAREEP